MEKALTEFSPHQNAWRTLQTHTHKGCRRSINSKDCLLRCLFFTFYLLFAYFLPACVLRAVNCIRFFTHTLVDLGRKPTQYNRIQKQETTLTIRLRALHSHH